MNSRTFWLTILAVAAMVAAVAGGWYALNTLTTGRGTSQSPDSSAAPGGDDEATKDRITMSTAKQQAAQIRIQAVALQPMSDSRTVPGRMQYDDRWHAKIRVATSGIVTEIRVKPGDQVSQGQTLAVISSPELGEARADVLKRHAEFEIAQRKQRWESQIETNLGPFVTAIQQRIDVKQLQTEYRSTTLGDYREKLVSAYTRFLLADSLLKNADSVTGTGILTARTIQERTTERQAAEAALLAACEQARFDAEQRRDLADLTASDAQRRSDISRQHLRALLGYEPTDDKPENKPGQDLSLVEVRAPFAGTIEQRSFSVSERVQANDELFVLANTSTLWIAADVREQDWRATGMQPGNSISVKVPALPERAFTATLLFVGREVAADTNAIPIVAEIDNRDGLLRPGLFVQATLTVGPPTEVLAVPSPAVVIHDQQSFVFLQENENTYRRVNVTTGRHADDWIEIRSGLKVGDPVVVQGAFMLKSELLLEPE